MSAFDHSSCRHRVVIILHKQPARLMQFRSKALVIVITSVFAAVVSIVLLQVPRLRGAPDLPLLSQQRVAIKLLHMFRVACSRRFLSNYDLCKARTLRFPSSSSPGNPALSATRGIAAKASLGKASRELSAKKIHAPSSSTLSSHASFSTALSQDPGTMTNPPMNGSAAAAARSEVSQEKHGNFDCVRRVTLDYAPGMSVEKWVSRVTGLTVVWANFESEPSTSL